MPYNSTPTDILIDTNPSTRKLCFNLKNHYHSVKTFIHLKFSNVLIGITKTKICIFSLSLSCVRFRISL